MDVFNNGILATCVGRFKTIFPGFSQCDDTISDFHQRLRMLDWMLHMRADGNSTE